MTVAKSVACYKLHPKYNENNNIKYDTRISRSGEYSQRRHHNADSRNTALQSQFRVEFDGFIKLTSNPIVVILQFLQVRK